MLEEEAQSVCSMASVSMLARRKDASRLPRMSSTFWAVVLLTALLVLYCGKSRCSIIIFLDHAYRHLGTHTHAGAQWVTVSWWVGMLGGGGGALDIAPSVLIDHNY